MAMDKKKTMVDFRAFLTNFAPEYPIKKGYVVALIVEGKQVMPLGTVPKKIAAVVQLLVPDKQLWDTSLLANVVQLKKVLRKLLPSLSNKWFELVELCNEIFPVKFKELPTVSLLPSPPQSSAIPSPQPSTLVLPSQPVSDRPSTCNLNNRSTRRRLGNDCERCAATQRMFRNINAGLRKKMKEQRRKHTLEIEKYASIRGAHKIIKRTEESRRLWKSKYCKEYVKNISNASRADILEQSFKALKKEKIDFVNKLKQKDLTIADLQKKLLEAHDKLLQENAVHMYKVEELRKAINILNQNIQQLKKDNKNVRQEDREEIRLLQDQANKLHEAQEEVAKDVVQVKKRYILSMKDGELDEYMESILDASDPKVRVFLQELRVRCGQDSHSNNSVKVYRKDQAEINHKNLKKKKNTEPGSVNAKSGGSHKLSNGAFHEMSSSLVNSTSSQNTLDTTIIEEVGVGAKRKTKFVPLFSKEGQVKSVIHLPGRHVCDCQAAKHKLINNCISCGRVVCDQEGAGPCVFCGTLVCSPEDQEIIDRGSKKGEKLRQYLMKNGGNAEHSGHSAAPVSQNKSKQGSEHALQHRDKLLEYDRTSAKRTQVIDDECDYYSTDSNQWLSNEEREKLRKREEELRNARHGSRRDRKITFDFAGRRVIDAEEDNAKKMYSREDDVLQEVHFGKSAVEKYSNAIANPDIQIQSLKYVESVPWGPRRSDKGNESNYSPSQSGSHRLQDKELQEISDDGMCLSMHQPWASLLIEGIKLHEGRTWYSSHRGRLWIASTAKCPTQEEIRELEHVHKHLHHDANLSFPRDYPTACLLGCVKVEDCLSQEEYREQFPNGESASPFVFICSNPQQLIVKFPIKGKHKIYKLDQHIHQAAKKGIR